MTSCADIRRLLSQQANCSYIIYRDLVSFQLAANTFIVDLKRFVCTVFQIKVNAAGFPRLNELTYKCMCTNTRVDGKGISLICDSAPDTQARAQGFCRVRHRLTHTLVSKE